MTVTVAYAPTPGDKVTPEGASIYGQVTCGGQPVEGVVMSDGVDVVKTNSDGVYRIRSEKKYGYVFISVPRGYETVMTGVIPDIWKPVTKGSSASERADFQLIRTDNDIFTLYVLGDMHLARKQNDINQFRDFMVSLQGDIDSGSGKQYGLTLGDMTWDCYWYANSFGFTEYKEEINRDLSRICIWHTMGNHDNDYRQVGDFLKENPYRDLLIKLLDKNFDDFIHKRWQRIEGHMHISHAMIAQLQQEIQKLNPRPGGTLGAKSADRAQSIQPDFLIDTDEDGTITVTLSRGNQPSLIISPDADGQQNAFVRQYVERGMMFINALQQRSETMLRTMQAIVKLQKPFFLEGDETLLHPMRLEDVAEATGYDISTISRVANSKFAETSFGTYPLKWFFKHRAIQNEEGDDVTAHQIMTALRHHLDQEDKRQPFSDERLTQMLQADGFNIARRTIAKYREQMGIPIARMRKS